MSEVRAKVTGGRRWLAVAALLGTFAVAGPFAASATSLGTLRAAGLGAAATPVTKCDINGVAISYLNEFNSLTQTYQTTEVALGDVAAACDGLAFRLTLSSPTAAVRELTGTIGLNGGARQSLALTPAIPAGQITRTALVITG